MRNEELGMRNFGMQCFGIAFLDKAAARSDANHNYSPLSQGGA